MSGYETFADYYDTLTRNVDYEARAGYLCCLLEKLGHPAGLTLDLACGTGSLTLALARRGIDIYGIDGSYAMLSRAREKAADAGFDILYLCQQMQKIDLYGTVDTVFCSLDSLNHLPSLREVEKTFERVSLFMNPGGWFVFDVNSLYKHREVLGDHTFVYDMEDIYCVWQNSTDPRTCRTRVDIDFFEKDGQVYHRSQEHFVETGYDPDTLETLLLAHGFDEVRRYADLSFDPPEPQTQRIVFATRRRLT